MGVYNSMGIWLIHADSVLILRKSLFTMVALEWFVTHVGLLMLVQFCSLDEFLFTKGAA